MTTDTEAPPSEDRQEEQRRSGLAAAVSAVQEMRQVTYRYRHALAPHAMVAGVWAAGVVLHGYDVPGWSVLAGVGVTGGLIAALFPTLRRKLAGRLWWVAASGWLAVAAHIGTTGWMQALLAAVGGLLILPRVWRYRVRINRPAANRRELAKTRQRQAIEGRQPDPNVAVWTRKVARRGGALPGSRLSDKQPFEYGIRYRIELDGQTTEDAMSARKQLCSDFGKPLDYLLVDETEDGLLNAAELTILDKLAVEDIQPWTEPGLDMQTGVWRIGPFSDGRGEAAIQVWEPGSGPLPVGIFGAMRVGKSSLIKQAAVEARRAGVDKDGNPLISLIYMDPQGGQSAPAILPHVPDPALGIDQIRDRLEQLRAEMRYRNDHLRQVEWVDKYGRKQRGKQSFDQPGMNGYDLRIVAIDEAHRVMAYDDLAEIVHELMAEGSKCGIMPWIIDQSALVDNVGGGAILGLLKSGNLVVLRTGDSYTAQATFGQRLEVYPDRIRKTFQGTNKHTKGCGYVLGATTRSVMMRIRDVDDIAAAIGDAPTPRMRWMTAAPSGDAPAGQAEPEPSDPAGDELPELGVDNVVEFVTIDAEQRQDAEQRILRLLDGAEQGLDAADLTLGAELPLVTVFQVASALVEQGAVQTRGDRYVRAS